MGFGKKISRGAKKAAKRTKRGAKAFNPTKRKGLRNIALTLGTGGVAFLPIGFSAAFGGKPGSADTPGVPGTLSKANIALAAERADRETRRKGQRRRNRGGTILTSSLGAPLGGVGLRTPRLGGA